MPDRTQVSNSEYADQQTEIVLGNKQLFSLLFVVFVLLGVFFAMGYVMGRSTTSADAATVAAGRSGPEAGIAESGPVNVRRPSAAGSDEAVRRSYEQTEPASPAGRAPTAPETALAETASPGKAAAAPAKAAAEESESAGAPRVVEPGPGQTYLQISAMNRRPEAEILVDVLRKKGFRAALEIAPNNMFRVLVGPAKDKEEAAEIRTKLEQSGFKPWVRHY